MGNGPWGVGVVGVSPRLSEASFTRSREGSAAAVGVVAAGQVAVVFLRQVDTRIYTCSGGC